MKKIIAATSLALFALAPAAAFAQGNSADNNSSNQDTATYPASGGAAGSSNSSELAYGALAGVGVLAVVGTSIAVANSGSDDKNVQLGGTGTTGTTGTN